MCICVCIFVSMCVCVRVTICVLLCLCLYICVRECRCQKLWHCTVRCWCRWRSMRRGSSSRRTPCLISTPSTTWRRSWLPGHPGCTQRCGMTSWENRLVDKHPAPSHPADLLTCFYPCHSMNTTTGVIWITCGLNSAQTSAGTVTTNSPERMVQPRPGHSRLLVFFTCWVVPGECWAIAGEVVVLDRFYTMLFSALEQIHGTRVWFWMSDYLLIVFF